MDAILKSMDINTLFKRTLRIAYPAGKGEIILRTELDWDLDILPTSVSEDGTTWTFSIETEAHFLYFKPCLKVKGKMHWSVGPNKLLLMGEEDQRIAYPYFFGSDKGTFSKLINLKSSILDHEHLLRVYLPPGYAENNLSTFPVAFMQDGQNLFFPREAFMGREWEIDEASMVLRAMSAVEELVIVGIHSNDRMKEYTLPGYELYAKALVEEIVPSIQSMYRIGDNRRWRSVWGSSLGGVVSFYSVWQYPEIFGTAICMSSTFSEKDDLMERVLHEDPPDVAFYLDSGWPGDNYEVTLSMAMALVARGWTYGLNLFHLGIPFAEHNESAWGLRLHLPMQILNGAVARASRIHHPVLKEYNWRR